MLKYGFSLIQNGTTQTTLEGTFVVPGVPKLTLVRMSVSGYIGSTLMPTLATLEGDINQPVSIGEVIDWNQSIIGSITSNRGVIHASDRVPFEGCWQVPQGITFFWLRVRMYEGYGSTLPTAPFNIGAWVNLIFETE